MQPGDLTSLANAKLWLGITDNASDTLVAALVTAVSDFVVDHLGRAPLAVTTFTEIYDVHQPDYLLLRQFPVVSVTSVSFGSQIVSTNAAATWPLQSGYLLEVPVVPRPQRLSLINYRMWKGPSAAQVIYTAGYQATGEPATVPGSGAYTVPTQRAWIGDVGVSYANGTAMTAVTGTPAAGQYSVAAGVYNFAPADANAAVLITYSYAPAPIVQAVNEIVGEAYKRMGHIGQSSKNQTNQGAITFSQLDMNNTAKALLHPYRRVAPV